MGFLVFWLASIGASFIMELASEFRLYKDVADAGYKVNIKRFNELGKQFNPYATKQALLSLLLPFGINIIMVFYRAMQYNNLRPFLIDQLSVIDALEEMTEEEKKEYSEKPTALNAILITLKPKLIVSSTQSIKINDKNGTSEIVYKMGESLENITIVEVTGPLSQLTVEEQKKEVIEAWKTLLQKGLEKYGNKEALFDAINNNKHIDLVNSKPDNKVEDEHPQSSQDLSSNEQSLESEPLEEPEVIKPTQSDKGPKLTKTIK